MDEYLEALLVKEPDLHAVEAELEAAGAALIECYRAGGKVLICGNGGSAADAEHVVGELMKGYLKRRPAPEGVREALRQADLAAGPYLADHLQGALPAISLVSHTALLTAIANDIAGDMIFAQQVYGYGRRDDVLMAISTSGNSLNVLQALRVARAMGLTTLGFTGRSGGQMRALCDVALCVPRDRTADIQELHLAIYHALCAQVEATMFPDEGV